MSKGLGLAIPRRPPAAGGEFKVRRPKSNGTARAPSRLRALDFEVIERINADERNMVDAVDEFYRKLRRADVGLFYFSGHGMRPYSFPG